MRPLLQDTFTLYAIARRGRGETDATEGHSLEDECGDVVALIRAVGEPVFLLGHSYGALCSVAAAALVPDRIRKLVLYEPAWPRILSAAAVTRLERLAANGAWDDLAMSFFGETLFVPVEELEATRATDLWAPIITDAKSSLCDLRAMSQYNFNAENYKTLGFPVLLQIGSESPRDLYVTDALAAALPNARIETLQGQAHEGMTTAPAMYAEAIQKFLLG